MIGEVETMSEPVDRLPHAALYVGNFAYPDQKRRDDREWRLGMEDERRRIVAWLREGEVDEEVWVADLIEECAHWKGRHA